jgi:DUF1365 family protein
MNKAMSSSAIYEGYVKHQRFSPLQHDFRYRLFMLFLNLDELDHVFNDFWLWSTKNPNLAYLKRTDHLGPENVNLKEAVSQFILDKTGCKIEGAVCLLTHLRYWGYCFNPVSFYYCYDKNNQHVEWIVAEINNTPWGERHCYLLDTRHDPFNRPYHFSFEKNFHISPLMPMNLRHDWWMTSPQHDLMIHMNNYEGEKKIFTAHMNLKRQEITHKNMMKMLCHYPCMTGRIIVAIYWQALRTKLKGAHFYSHPHH